MTSHAPGEAGRDAEQVLRPPLTTRLRPWHWVAIDAVIALLSAVALLVGSTRPAYGIP